MKSSAEIGDLRTRMTIQQMSSTPDAIGGESTTWVTFALTWGKVASWRGLEIFTGQQTTPVNRKKITIRYVAGLTTAMRLQFGNPTRTLQIKSINYLENEAKHFIEMECDEGIQT